MKQQIKKILGITFILIVILLFLKTLIINWSQIQSYNFKLNILHYILSTIIIVYVIFLWSFIWNLILKDLNCKELSFLDSFRIHIYSWFGKYIPGKIGIIGTKYYLARKEGINNQTIIFSSIYENIFQILSAFIISIPILSYYFLKELNANPLLYKILPTLFIIGTLIFIHPKIFFLFINTGLKIIKKKPIEKKHFLTEFQILKYIILYSIGIIANGIAFYIFINSIINLPINQLIPVIGIFNFAGVIGLLAIFVPAGIGVREGIMVLFLQTFMPIEISILLSILSRLWITLADVILGLYIVGYKLLKNKK